MRLVAKLHIWSGFSMTYIKGECEQDEQGNAKADREFLYLKSGPVKRKDIRSCEIIPVYEEDDPPPISRA